MPNICGKYNFSRFAFGTKSKFNVSAKNQRTCDGITFDSKAEMNRYKYLLTFQQSGIIQDLTLQPKFELLPAFVDFDGNKVRAINYIADFMYYFDGKLVVEDVKGVVTKEFAIKKKMFLYNYPDYIFREVHNVKTPVDEVVYPGRDTHKSSRKTHSTKQSNKDVK